MYRVTLSFAPDDFVPPRLEQATTLQPLPARPYLLDAASPHLHERIAVDRAAARVTAVYDFDDAYAKAHSASVDREHLELLHGTLAAKILDEDVIALDDAGLVATLRWRTIGQLGTRLGRDGTRRRED